MFIEVRTPRAAQRKGKRMRLIPVLTAIVVSVVLFLAVMQRETLMRIAGLTPGAEADAAGAGTDGATAAASGTPAPGAQPGHDQAADDQPPAVRVVVQRSVARDVDSAVVLRGQTRASRQVDLRAETSGTVASEPLRKGAMVAAGDVMCEIAPGTRPAALAEAEARLSEARARMPEAETRIPSAEAQLETARAQLEEARINENAARRLSQGGFASDSRVAAAAAALRGAEAAVKSAEAGVKSAQSAVLNVQAAIQSAEAGVDAARREIERLRLAAPFAGLLETDTAELGSLLQPGALCATILQLDPIRLAAFVPETEVARITVGAMAGARLTSGQEITGTVTFLSRAADPTTRTFLVEIEAENRDLAIRDGQTAEIMIAAEGAAAHLVPQSALTLNDDGALGLRTVDADNRVLFRPVTLIRDTMQGVWVSGLPEQADVIVVGQEYVTDGVLVAPSLREATQ